MADLLDAHAACAATGPSARGILTFMTGAGGAAFAQERGFHGSVLHVSAGSVSAACAVGEACGKIASGEADLAVAGGAECPLHPDVVDTFAAAGILAGARGGDPSCRPFDARRAGTVLGEGAAAFTLEAEDHARRRGAACIARVAGFGLTCEGHSMVAPDPEGAGVARAVMKALDEVSPAGIDWIKAHGTGTLAGDEAECRGLAAVFGDRLAATPLTALKPALGHCLGASGAVEMAACVLALRAGFIPATLGSEEPDPSLAKLRLVCAPERCETRSVLLLSESFGGRSAALVLTRAA
jgi:3-oxoacyl-[acyl-carrier-protein] synthase II